MVTRAQEEEEEEELAVVFQGWWRPVAHGGFTRAVLSGLNCGGGSHSQD